MENIPLVIRFSRDGGLLDLKNLIGEGCDVNQRDRNGVSALISAAQHGHAHCVGVLLTADADVNAYDVNSQTSLIFASMRGHAACVRLLLEAGAYKDASNAWGNTALMQAASQNHLSCVELLLDARATVSSTNKQNKDALAMAKQMKHREIETMVRQALDMQRLVLTLHVEVVSPEDGFVDVRLTDMSGSEQAACTAALTAQFSFARAQLSKSIGTDSYQLLLPSGRLLSNEDDTQLLSTFVDSCQIAQLDSCL